MNAPPTKKQLQKSGTILMLVGFLVYFVSVMSAGLAQDNVPVIVLAVAGILGGLFVFVIGCMRYAVSRGYSKWLGLVGLAGLIGLIILAVLPDKWAEEAPPSATNYPRYPQG